MPFLLKLWCLGYSPENTRKILQPEGFLAFFLNFLLFLRLVQRLGIGQIVDGNGQENIEQDIVTDDKEQNEVDRDGEAKRLD